MSSTNKEKIIRTVCRLADWETCALSAHIKGGKLVKLEPADDFPDPGYRHVCARGLASIKIPYQPDRIKYPLKRVGKRGEGKWKRISWDEALETIANKFHEIASKYGPEAVAAGGNTSICVTEAYKRFLSAFQGGTWLSVIGGYADSAGPGGDLATYGWYLGEMYNMDFESPGLCVVWGGNPADTMPCKWRRIRKFKENGTKLVVIDPLFTATASKADQFIGIRPGTDAALAWGIMKYLLDQEACDLGFVRKYTVGPFLVRDDTGQFLREKDIRSNQSNSYMVWDEKADGPSPNTINEAQASSLTGTFTVEGIVCRPAFQLLIEEAATYPVERVSEITGLEKETIVDLAHQYVSHKPVASFRMMGLQRTFHGDLTWRAINTLQALTGSVNLEGGKQFMLNSGKLALVGKNSARVLPLLEMYDAIVSSKPYPVRALWVSSANLLNQIPNMNKVMQELVPKLKFIVDSDIVMNTTAQYADVVLPRCTFFECSDLLPPAELCYHPYLQLQQAVIAPMYESKTDYEIIKLLAQKMGFGKSFDMSWEQFLEQMLDSGHPSVAGATLEKLKRGPFKLPSYSIPEFTSPSGRIEFYVEKLKAFNQELPIYLEPLETANRTFQKQYPLCLFSTHSKYRMNSTFTDNPWLRELDPEPVLEMNPIDCETREIEDGDRITVFNKRGSVGLTARLHEGIRPGVVNLKQGWWPEHFSEGSHQNLTHNEINPVQKIIFEPNAAVFDVRVEVRKAMVPDELDSGFHRSDESL